MRIAHLWHTLATGFTSCLYGPLSMYSGVSVQLPMVLLAVQEQFSLWTAIGVDCSDQICDLAIRDKPKCIKLFLAFTLISDTWSFNCKCSDSSWFKMTPSDNFEHVRLHDPRWHLQHHMLSFNIMWTFDMLMHWWPGVARLSITSSCFRHQDTANELNSPHIGAASVNVQQRRFFFFFALL